jgi:multidrug efflux pump subunit AcrB
VVARVSPLELGPPVGWPVQYRVTGPDPTAVREIAYKLAQVMAADPRAQKINFDWIETSRTVRVRVNQDQARLLGVSSQDLAQSLNTVFAGSTITQIRDDIYLVDVIGRARSDERGSLATLRNLQVSLPGGANAPLSQMATFEYGQELPLIWRRDRVPTLTVQSDVSPGVLPATLVTALKPSIDALNGSLSQGYKIEAGGIVEESGKSQRSVAVVVPVMLFLMFTILMIQLQSFQRLFLVVSVAPLGLIGVVGALLLSGKPLGFVALLGVLALTGMIARNSVILIDQIEHEKGQGMHPWDATIEATSHRFRPILLTAAAAILGMIPIAPTVFWGPMAYAIMGGLAVATLLTLVFLPALYVAWFRVKEPAAPSAT